MAQHLVPQKTTVKIVPRDGEIEITLNINISLDGTVTATTPNKADVNVVQNKENDEDKVEPLIPDFKSGGKLSNFGIFKKKK